MNGKTREKGTMAKVGIRELKLHANEIVRGVERDSTTYEVTVEGEPVAVLEPVTHGIDQASLEEIWNERRQLGQEFGKNWNGKLTVLEAIAEQRR